MTNDLSESYDANYYATYGERPLEPDDPAYVGFFDTVAKRVGIDIRPSTVLDVGCAFGMLVAALNRHEIDAKGFDFSEYAIERAVKAHPELDGRVWRGSALEPIEGRYDLITCIEVIEHLDEADGRTAIENMTAATDTILLSSAPTDFVEPTHLNVRPTEYWSDLMAAQGFFRSHEIDVSFVSPWACLYVRAEPDLRSTVLAYERSLSRAVQERNELRTEVQRLSIGASVAEERLTTIRELEANFAIEREEHAGTAAGKSTEHEAEIAKLQATIVELQTNLMIAKDAAIGARAETAAAEANLHLHLTDLHAMQTYYNDVEPRVEELRKHAAAGIEAGQQVEQIHNSTTWKLMWAVLTPYRKLKTRILGHG